MPKIEYYLSPAVLKMGRENIAVVWRGNENFLHWLLKVAVVKELLEHGVPPRNVELEATLGRARPDIVVQGYKQSFWIECERDVVWTKWNDAVRNAKNASFRGRIVVATLRNDEWFEKRVGPLGKEMRQGEMVALDAIAPNSEWWCVDFEKEITNIGWGIRKEKDKTISVLIDEYYPPHYFRKQTFHNYKDFWTLRKIKMHT